jgi:hypothetical protein
MYRMNGRNLLTKWSQYIPLFMALGAKDLQAGDGSRFTIKWEFMSKVFHTHDATIDDKSLSELRKMMREILMIEPQKFSKPPDDMELVKNSLEHHKFRYVLMDERVEKHIFG